MRGEGEVGMGSNLGLMGFETSLTDKVSSESTKCWSFMPSLNFSVTCLSGVLALCL